MTQITILPLFSATILIREMCQQARRHGMSYFVAFVAGLCYTSLFATFAHKFYENMILQQWQNIVDYFNNY